MITISITATDHCRTLESLLRTRMPRARRSFAATLVRSGKALVNGCKVLPGEHLFAGDSVTLKESGSVRHYLADLLQGLDILYEDDSWLIVAKPAGIPMHRTAESDIDLVAFGEDFMEKRGTPCRLYPVNRLDRGTSGAVILAKSSKAAGILGRYVKENGLNKIYLAVAAGFVPEVGEIDEPLDGKDSLTRFSLLAVGEDCSLVALEPVSGRMHQIRRHLAHIGHPVIGDRRYGTGPLASLPGFALHSFLTEALIPDFGTLRATAPLPEAFLKLCVERNISVNIVLDATRGLIRLPQ